MRAPLAALVAGFLLLGCSDDTPTETSAPPPSADAAPTAPAGDGLLALASINASLSGFAQAVEAAGLADELSAEGPFTVFAPSDRALEAAGGLDALAADPDALAERLSGHILPTRMLAADIFAPISIETLSGAEIEVDAPVPGQVTVRSGDRRATVTAADLDASNGVIHIIDTLL